VVGLTVVVAAVILLWLLSSAYQNGKLYAQSEVVLKNANILTQGLEYFYDDQNRYPTLSEFTDPENTAAMLNYFSFFPAPDVVSKNCQRSFLYKHDGPRSYQLNFCLPGAISGWPAGWNQTTKSR